MLPSYSFGAEGVEYGRKAPFYVPSSGPLTLPDDLLVKGDLTVNGTSTLTGAVAVAGPLSVGTGGVSTTGSLLTGSATTPGGAVFGYDGSAVRAPNFPRGLESQGTVSVTGSSGNLTVGGGVYGIDTATRVNFPAGFLALGGTISGGGTGGSLLVLGDTQRPGGAIVGYDGVSVTRPPNFPFGLVTTVPTVTKSGIDDPVLNWDQTLVPGVGYKQDGPGTVYIPDDWQTNLDLPAGLFATFISYGIGNSTCNAVTRDGTVRQTTGSRTIPNITYFYLMRSANGVNNTIVYVVQQGIATGASIPQ